MDKTKRTKTMISMIAWLFITAGAMLTSYLMGLPFKEMLIPIIGGTTIGLVVSFLSSWISGKRNGNVPAYDERTWSVMKNYLLIAFYVIMIISSVILLVLVGMDIERIETGWLAVYLGGIFLLLGAGAWLTKRFG